MGLGKLLSSWNSKDDGTLCVGQTPLGRWSGASGSESSLHPIQLGSRRLSAYRTPPPHTHTEEAPQQLADVLFYN